MNLYILLSIKGTYYQNNVQLVFFNKIFKELNWGGGFLFFEKVRAPDARFQDIMSLIYNDFKLDNKFTPKEIIAKSRSLKGVLEPFSSKANIELLKRMLAYGFPILIS